MHILVEYFVQVQDFFFIVRVAHSEKNQVGWSNWLRMDISWKEILLKLLFNTEINSHVIISIIIKKNKKLGYCLSDYFWNSNHLPGWNSLELSFVTFTHKQILIR